MSVQALVSTQEIAAPERPIKDAPIGQGLDRRAVIAGTVVLVALWLTLRPTRAQGIAAEIDLLVLPALLFALVGVLLHRRTTLSPANLAIFFGLGAVFAPLAALLIQRSLLAAFGASAAHAVGPLVEILATSAPVIAFALLPAGRRMTVADATLAGLASGLGFLLVQTSLVTAATHAAPDYVTPLLAGWLQIPASPGSPAVFFIGSGLATALVGLGVGLGVRYRHRPWRLLPPGTTLVLVTFDHKLFDWRLERFAASEFADPAALVDIAQQVTLQGRLALVLLAGGLVLALRADRPVAEPAATVDSGAAEDGEPADDVLPPDEPRDRPPQAETESDSVEPVDLLRRYAPVLAVTAGVAIALSWLARARMLDVLQNRPLALVVSLLGLAYSSWCLQAIRRPAALPPSEDLNAVARHHGRRLLCFAAIASSGLGVIWSLLPTADAGVPLHGALFVDAALGWAAGTGNLGVLLGLGGLTAPPSAYERPAGGWWRHLSLWSRQAGGSGKQRWGRAGTGGTGRTKTSGRGADKLSAGSKLSTGRLGRLLRGRAGRGSDASGVEARRELPLVLRIDPVYQAPRRTEATGVTVKEAIQTALRQLDLDLAHASLQLLDAGGDAEGRGGGRPARVRVTAKREGSDLFVVSPSRDSITRDTPITVIVEMAVDDDAEPASSIEVTLGTFPPHRSGSRVLTCSLEDSSPGIARYRSNPYSVDSGEDTTWAEESWWAGAAAAGGIRVGNGTAVVATHRRERATVTVYDSWTHQVVAVNQRLLEITTAHHQRALGEVEERLAELDGSGGSEARLQARADQLRIRLGYVEQAHLLFADPGIHQDEAAFTSTVLLHLAMSFDATDTVDLEAAQDALRHHRLSLESVQSTDAGSTYWELLMKTALGQLWTQGAGSSEQIARVLGWDSGVRFESAQPSGLPRGEDGLSLIEMLVTIVIMGIAFATIVGGIGTAIIGADIQKQRSGADVALRTAAEAIVYEPCATKAVYQPKVTSPTNFMVTVTAVSRWNATENTFERLTEPPAACTPTSDTGLQLIELRAVSTGGPRTSEETLSVVKRLR